MQNWEYLSLSALNAVQDDLFVSKAEAGTFQESQTLIDEITAKKATGLVQCLNMLGERGWELCFALPIKAMGIPQGSAKLILKRPKL